MKNEIGRIAISGKELAIFGSVFGFAGPVIQDYMPFENEAVAIKAAKEKIISLGLPVDPVISRPFVSSFKMYKR